MRPLQPDDREWVVSMVRHWGDADHIISRERVIYPAALPGFCAVDSGGSRLGLAVYELIGRECQLVLLETVVQFAGAGTALVEAVRQSASEHGCTRLWLVTTNDNLEALRFYQRRGFELVAVHRGLRKTASRYKPTLPVVGAFGIPILSELELEMRLS